MEGKKQETEMKEICSIEKIEARNIRRQLEKNKKEDLIEGIILLALL